MIKTKKSFQNHNKYPFSNVTPSRSHDIDLHLQDTYSTSPAAPTTSRAHFPDAASLCQFRTKDHGTFIPVLVHSRRRSLRGVPSQFTEAHLPWTDGSFTESVPHLCELTSSFAESMKNYKYSVYLARSSLRLPSPLVVIYRIAWTNKNMHESKAKRNRKRSEDKVPASGEWRPPARLPLLLDSPVPGRNPFSRSFSSHLALPIVVTSPQSSWTIHHRDAYDRPRLGRPDAATITLCPMSSFETGSSSSFPSSFPSSSSSSSPVTSSSSRTFLSSVSSSVKSLLSLAVSSANWLVVNVERCDANKEFRYVEWLVEWFEGRINDLCTNRTSPCEDHLLHRRYGIQLHWTYSVVLRRTYSVALRWTYAVALIEFS